MTRRVRRKAKKPPNAPRSTLRKRKRSHAQASTAQPPPTPAPRRKAACRATLFDTLSPELLQHVLHISDRHLTRAASRCQNSWLFDLRGPFARIAASTFHTLHLHSQRRIRCWPSRGVIELGRNDQRTSIERLLTVAGRGIRRIELHSCSVEQLCRTEVKTYAALLARKCPAAKTLLAAGLDSSDATRDTIEAFTLALGPQLDALQLRARPILGTDEPAVLGTTAAKELPSLASIQLREFTYRGDSIRHLDPLWHAARVTLRKVHLVYEEHADWLPTFDALRRCQRLEDVYLDNPLRDNVLTELRVTEDKYAEFISSFGARLRRARLCSLGAEHLERIVKACPNLRASLFEKRCNFARVDALAPCLEQLALRVKRDADWGALKSAIGRCSHLTSLKVTTKPDFLSRYGLIDDACFRAVFHTSSPLNHLEHLDLRTVLMPFLLDPLPKLTGRLRSLNLHFSECLLPSFIYDLVVANPYLEKLSIEDQVPRNERNSSSYIRCVVGCFLQCKAPRKLSIAALGSTEPNLSFVYWTSTLLSAHGIDYDFTFCN